ncbi:putative MFS transporter [Xylaria sp. FL0064]|nr:putative MFS transporter [Xylaria sp. FL0064]
MFRFHSLLLLILGALASLAAAGSAPMFCKCTCGKNSTLIQLGPQSSCAQCTHAYCLSQDLPICKDVVGDKNSNNGNNNGIDGGGGSGGVDVVLSTCIQRDSRKDQIIVWAFILGTAGLLGWAGARRLGEMRDARRKAMRGASAVGGGGGGPDLRDDRGPYIPISAGARG